MAHKQKLRSFHLFAGAGGGILADLILGHEVIGACEIEKYPRDVLLARQRDGILPAFPVWDNVCTLDGNPWRGSVDILCGGFPCQDISAAGKGAGITGERSGLWKEYARLIREMRPRFVFAENSPLLRTRGLGVVLEDLASLGYNARWGVLGARDVGAPHKRDRMWILAYAISQGLQGGLCARGLDSQGRQESDGSTSECGGLWWHTDPANVLHPESEGGGALRDSQEKQGGVSCGNAQHPSERGVSTQDRQRTVKPLVGRVAHGVANRVDRLKAIGNGQVPQCAAMAFSILSEGLI
jgi:DNA (cytosine-5)-methyltransferase 1